MDINYNKTNKLKPINKLRRKYLTSEYINSLDFSDDDATHYVLSSDDFDGCVSYIFKDKIIYVYAFASSGINFEDVLEYIKSNTKQFECKYIIK